MKKHSLFKDIYYPLKPYNMMNILSLYFLFNNLKEKTFKKYLLTNYKSITYKKNTPTCSTK